MFGSSDDKKTPDNGEKKGLFGWLRKKPQQEAAPAPAAPAVETSPETPAAPAVEAVAAPVIEPEQPAAAPVAAAPVVEAVSATWPLLPTTRTATTLPVMAPAAAPVPMAAGLLV